ncbi:MAG: ABC transporter ATP-binding protein, partial [Deltaproteobacteria bacterium]|nr:ABC transporter ATP-binding protein [Deltaproteobacteria bacterium]
MQAIRDYELALDQVHSQPENSEWQKQLIRMTQQMDVTNAWQLENDAKTILTRLGITDFAAIVSTLSGGQ